MPELPEVEHYRRILLPLVGGGPIVLHCPPPSPTKRFPSRRVVDLINAGRYDVGDVLRKGKVLCMILTRDDNYERDDDDCPRAERSGDGDDDDDDAIATITGREPTIYLSLHMGMTGRISSPIRGVPKLESLSDDETYPPSHSHLILRTTDNGMEAAFSDPRRFGSVLVDAPGKEEAATRDIDDRDYDDDDDERWSRREDRIPTFRDIAPDAWEASGAARRSKSSVPSTTVVEGLMNRKKGIKGLLLDQRAVVSGVGNWVADELLYRCRIHPDQTYLTIDEARSLVGELHRILSTAIARLDVDDDFPDDWLFHRRWRSGGGGNAMAKDINGRTITFIQSGGRSTAIVPSIQKKLARTSAPRSKKEDSATRRAKLEDDPDKKPGKKGKVKEERATSKPIPRTRKAKLEDAVGQNQKVTARSSASKKLVKKRKVKEEGVTSKPITQPTRMSGRLRRSR